ncbi:general secretion pathway protein GspK [Rubritalea spongiae]|uniref:General secretion pathway protein GspK n=1 Tax=Rubritalea spongiae TaxID=430797 RepID=A0ABW5E834_9BACT
MKARKYSSQRQPAGVALIAVLWVVAFLSAVLVVTLTLLKVDVDENITEVQSFRAWQQAHTGLSVGIHPNVERDDPLLYSQDTGYDEGYQVKIEPESTRLNINTALQDGDTDLLFNLFKNWGMEDKPTDQLIDALIDWVDADEIMSLNGAEREYYEDIGYTDRPFNRPFNELDELPLVRGFGVLERLQPNWREFFTVWTSGGLDIHEAEPELIAAAAEVELSVAQEHRSFVMGDDGIMGTEDDARFSDVNEALDDMLSPAERRDLISERFSIGDSVIRIESIGYSGTYRYAITAISSGKGTNSNLLDYQEKRLERE